MRITRLTWHRIFGISLALWVAFLLTNYYLELGFFGRGAKGLMILTIGVGCAWGAFFAPRREELRENAGRSQKDDHDPR